MDENLFFLYIDILICKNKADWVLAPEVIIGHQGSKQIATEEQNVSLEPGAYV